MTTREFPESAWRKSSYSGAGNGDCVEAAVTGDLVGVRDSKTPHAEWLALRPAAWRALLSALRD